MDAPMEGVLPHNPSSGAPRSPLLVRLESCINGISTFARDPATPSAAMESADTELTDALETLSHKTGRAYFAKWERITSTFEKTDMTRERAKLLVNELERAVELVAEEPGQGRGVVRFAERYLQDCRHSVAK